MPARADDGGAIERGPGMGGDSGFGIVSFAFAVAVVTLSALLTLSGFGLICFLALSVSGSRSALPTLSGVRILSFAFALTTVALSALLALTVVGLQKRRTESLPESIGQIPGSLVSFPFPRSSGGALSACDLLLPGDRGSPLFEPK